MGSTAHKLSKHERRGKDKYYKQKDKAYKATKLKWQEALNGSTFSALRHDLSNDPLFGNLSPYAVKVFCYFLGKFDGSNNGELLAPQGLASSFMGISVNTMKKAIKELLEKEILEVTEYCTKSTPYLYGLTCFPMFNEERASDKWKKHGATKCKQ